MKTFISLFSALILVGFSVNAETTKSTFNHNDYGNSFIFVENGIEFSVFRDGQFDFNVLDNNAHFNASINTPNVSISFNNGYDYTPYLQYDEFGAVIQIQNTPIFYDYYGRVNQVGNINIFYNNFGYISRVGGLYIHYNRYNRFSHYTGYINVYNRSYVYRPWHNYYVAPPADYCVVYNRPYRQYYTPVRYVYNRPFCDNYRPVSSVYSRQGDYIVRNRNYATANRNSRNITHVSQDYNTRRSSNFNESNDYNHNNTVIGRNNRTDHGNHQRTNYESSRTAQRENHITSEPTRRNITQNNNQRENNVRVIENQQRNTQYQATRSFENSRNSELANRQNSGNDNRISSVRRR